jgi:hypothetical protein
MPAIARQKASLTDQNRRGIRRPMTTQSAFEHWSDEDVLLEVKRLAGRERQATVELIAALMELDARRLYLGEGCSSLFSYCTRVLHLSEHAAYGRIEAARAARRFPVILDLLAEGSLNLTAVGLLAPHLTPENQRELLDAARHSSKREVEHLIARLRPEPPLPSSVRKLPTAKEHQAPAAPCEREPLGPDLPGSGISNRPSVPSRPAILQPLAPERYKIQFTVGRETYERLRRAQDLLRHAIPNGDAAAIFDRALTLLVADLERRKLGVTVRPRSCRAAPRGSRYIPAAVRRAVWTRDGGRCAFVGTHGRCAETGFLEFHHVVPYATGGQATVDNLELRCAAHNAYEAAQFFAPQEPVLLKEEAGLVYSHGCSVRTESANAKGRPASRD